MTDITFSSDMTVELIDHMGSDQRVVQAARVSLKGANDVDEGEGAGLINYLLGARHGSTTEHCVMTFYVKAPIFVMRELMRHRMASFNEISGRYAVLPGEFYLPAPDRPLVNVGTSARPEFAPGDEYMHEVVVDDITEVAGLAWQRYQNMLAGGIANEVARMVLPVNIMSQAYVTMNLRGLMNFLSLRVDSPDSTYRSRPQLEIQMVAERMEQEFSRLFPLTHEAFVSSGRVGP